MRSAGHQAEAVAHADLPPPLPAEDGRTVEQDDAAHLGFGAARRARRRHRRPADPSGPSVGDGVDDVDQMGGQVDLDGFQHGREQLGLVGELVVQRPAGDAGGLGDAFGADLGVAVLGEQCAAAATSAAAGGGGAVGLACGGQVSRLTSMQTVCNLRTCCTQLTSEESIHADRDHAPPDRCTTASSGPDESAAPPVVFVHGFLVDSTLWDASRRVLADAGVRSYLVDWPLGSHRTPMARRRRPVAGRRRQARSTRCSRRSDLDDVTLVGNDTGGAICQLVLASDADPHRPRRADQL